MYAVLIPAIAVLLIPSVQLRPETAGAFDRYTRFIEAQMQHTLNPPRFLSVDLRDGDNARMRQGQMVVFSERAAGTAPEMQVPGGEIHDWTGAVFIPHASLAKARSVLQDYDNYKNIYKPDVVDSRLLTHDGARFRVFLRLMSRQLVTVAYNSEYDIVYDAPDARHMRVHSRSIRIAQIKDPDKSLTEENAVGDDWGFLWRINAYWRFEEADGGIYAECRAVSLSRSLPFLFGWLRGVIQQFPKQSMVNTLSETKRAIAGGSA